MHNRTLHHLSLRLFSASLLLEMAMCNPLLASPFAKQFRFTQPDGSAIRLWGQGDDFAAVFETLEGYTVIFVPETRTYFYAKLSANGGSLESTGAQLGREDPALLGLTRHLRISPEVAIQAARSNRAHWDSVMHQTKRWNDLKRYTLGTGPRPQTPPDFQTVGVKCGLTVLIDFEDERGTFSREDVIQFLNGENYTRFGNNGSVRQYFADVSNGLLTFTNVVTPYVTIPNSVHPRSYYNDPTKDCFQQCQYLIRDALDVMKKLPNYTNDFLPLYDAVTVDSQRIAISANFFVAGMDSGVWSKGIWGQSSALSDTVGQKILSPGKIIDRYELTPIGGELLLMVFCHENGHLLCGFPDIYDYHYDANFSAGRLCLMSGGQMFDTNPSQVCAYLKSAAGWANVVDLPRGTNFLASLSSIGPGFNRFFRYRKPGTTTEYFLMENRQKTGRDAEIPGSGIAIWHIDELGDRDNQSVQPNASHLNCEVTLVQADNRWDLEFYHNSGDVEDLYYEGNSSLGYANAFSDLTSPSAQWWNGTRSGLTLSDFSTNGATMRFQIQAASTVVVLDPVDLTVLEGQSAAFGFTLAITVTNPAIQWYKDGNPLLPSAGINGIDSKRLQIASAALANAGVYSAVIGWEGGTTATRTARLTVTTSPLFATNYGAGTTTLLPVGVDLTAASASGFGTIVDYFRFAGQNISGDFDVRVRLLGINTKSEQTQAGLTIRAGLNSTAPHISILNRFIPDGERCDVLTRFTNPGVNQDLFSTLTPHWFPDEFESWLRLRREGNRFTCYRSRNGSEWVWLKSVECDLGQAPYLGVVLASGSGATAAAAASFRNYQVLTNTPATVAIFSPDPTAIEGSLDDAQIAVHASRNGPMEVRVVFSGATTNGVDFLAPTTVTIPSSTNVGTLSIRAINNVESALPKRVEISLARQPQLELIQPTNTSALILDDETPVGGLSRQVYSQIGGSAVRELSMQMTNTTAITDVDYVTSFEVNTSSNLSFYGQVLSGYVVPPETGDYVFYLASDDTSELWLSTDENPANLRRIASVAGFTLFRFYTGSGNHSGPVSLQKGKYYCVRGLQKQKGGDSFFSVALQLPGAPPPANGSDPIGSQHLAFSLPAAPAVQLVFLDGSVFPLRCKTGGAQSVLLEASHDLRNWVPVWANALPARLDLGTVDPTPINQARFYRARLE
jgi:M6 family metalloprotease-like protein